jgi:hypothetical protein
MKICRQGSVLLNVFVLMQFGYLTQSEVVSQTQDSMTVSRNLENCKAIIYLNLSNMLVCFP